MLRDARKTVFSWPKHTFLNWLDTGLPARHAIQVTQIECTLCAFRVKCLIGHHGFYVPVTDILTGVRVYQYGRDGFACLA